MWSHFLLHANINLFPFGVFLVLLSLSPNRKVDKNQFLKIIQDYTATSADEAEAIASLRAEYPYSQILQTLTARTSKDHGFPSQQVALQTAAVYASDRSLLKEIILLQPQTTTRQVVSHRDDADKQAIKTVDETDVADVVMDDLDRLSRLKDTFEHLFMASPEAEDAPAEEVERARTQPVESSTTEKKSELSPIKSKKERIIEMAKALNPPTATDENSAPKKKRSLKVENPADEFISEIQQSKSEIEPASEFQRQQIEIIDQFIAVQPSISNPRDRTPSATGDLMPIKAGEFGDNIVSETLAEILIKQGKKERAIEVLKKLIWKYPQKKAYFASQIESLKK